MTQVLYATNRNVDAENESKMEELSGGTFVFVAEDSVHVDPQVSERRWPRAQALLWRDGFFSRQCVVASTLRLKLHSQVMLLKNRWQDLHLPASDRLVNGSRGVVVSVCLSVASCVCVQVHCLCKIHKMAHAVRGTPKWASPQMTPRPTNI
jgi:hypothetical protein